MDWYSIDMPPGSLANGAYHKLCRTFQRAFIDAGAPNDLALFALRSGEELRRLFLTPSSPRYVPELIRRYGGYPCTPPAASAVTLVYGVPGAMALLARVDDSPDGGRPVIGSPDEASRERANGTSVFPWSPERRAASNG